MAVSAEVVRKARLLLLINLVQYVFLAVAGAVLIDDAISSSGYEISEDGRCGFVRYKELTAASGFADFFVTIAGVVGAAAVLPGLHHLRAWSQGKGNLPAAAYSGFMALLLTLLALGFAIKEAILGASVHEYKLGSTEIFPAGKIDERHIRYGYPKV
uniref:Uncharacterized protein n=1 Tax=Avena sativa TaxID=4498 RepID=A0ACD5ZCM1_AVESA